MAIQLSSVQSIYIEMFAGQDKIGSGTGFVTHGPSGTPFLITNRHNVTGRHQFTGAKLGAAAPPSHIQIFHNMPQTNSAQLSWVFKTEPLIGKTGDNLWHEHPVHGAKFDVVCLPLTDTAGVKLYPCSLGVGDPTVAFGPADVVSVIGFPFGRRPGMAGLAVWATGFVATEPSVDHDQLPVFLVDCRGRPGQSGSRVVAHRSGAVAMEDGNTAIGGTKTRFLGVYSGRINNKSDLGIVWKASAVKELVDSAP